jgi:hypothetical protein
VLNVKPIKYKTMKNLNRPTREEVEKIIINNDLSYTIYDENKEEIETPISRVRNNAVLSVVFEEKNAIITVKNDWSI